MTTNAQSTKVAAYLSDLAEETKGSPRFARFSTRLAGEVRAGLRRGDHVMEYVLLTGASYLNMVTRSIEILDRELQSETFIPDLVSLLASREVTDEKTKAPITESDVIDAVFGIYPGRKGLLIGLRETAEGVNSDSLSAHVYEPLVVDEEQVLGCKVYRGLGDPNDPKAPVPGTIYLEGIVISSRVVERSPNGDKIPSKRGACVVVKEFLQEHLDLPVRRFRTFRLLPREATSLKCGEIAFHVVEGVAAARPGAVPIEKLIHREEKNG